MIPVQHKPYSEIPDDNKTEKKSESDSEEILPDYLQKKISESAIQQKMEAYRERKRKEEEEKKKIEDK